ncbi:hypothetical protein T10_1793 [Trichinella papuae]|uniref:Uncharacterized protein n=1 Tax=Trichinella papuae TaxID=268474 RepID=A0A0V1N1B7_9BILA|nr:hypothetical protein T10_1793 [Trichinella papuae]
MISVYLVNYYLLMFTKYSKEPNYQKKKQIMTRLVLMPAYNDRKTTNNSSSSSSSSFVCSISSSYY